MKMIVTGIELDDIRRYPKNTKISFLNSNGNLAKQTFVMMKNGTGKTTIIELIKATLDGTAESWSQAKVREFQPIGWNTSCGQMKLLIKFDNKIYNYILRLDYEMGKAIIRTVSSAGGGETPRQFPLQLNGLFTEDFVHRFVFDGEQAEKTMDNQSNEAEEAIKYLYRLDVFDAIKRENQLVLTKIQEAAKGKSGSDQSVLNLRTRQSKIGEEIIRLKSERVSVISNIKELEEKQNELNSRILKIDKKYESLNKEKQDATKERDKKRANLDGDIIAVLDFLKSPYLVSRNICDRMYEFGDSMTKLKLPKTISKDFFIELSKQKTCVCGREIGSLEKDSIQRNAARYLGSDQQSALNYIKNSLMQSAFENTLVDEFKGLKEDIAYLQAAEDKVIQIDDKLAKAGGEEAQKLRKERDDFKEEIGKLKSRLETIDSKDETNPSLSVENNLHKAQLEWDRLEASIATATKTNDALHRKEVVEDIINRIQFEATYRLKKEIIRKTNEKLRDVIPDDIVEIDTIDNYIQLKGKSGASAGQTLSVAYCFLGTMFEDSELLFPFIIDSPCGSMDFDKRKAVAKILPDLFNQIVAFVMSAEVDSFANQFYDIPTAKFITVEANKENGTIAMHDDKEYFDSYQRTHKEEDQ